MLALVLDQFHGNLITLGTDRLETLEALVGRRLFRLEFGHRLVKLGNQVLRVGHVGVELRLGEDQRLRHVVALGPKGIQVGRQSRLPLSRRHQVVFQRCHPCLRVGAVGLKVVGEVGQRGTGHCNIVFVGGILLGGNLQRLGGVGEERLEVGRRGLQANDMKGRLVLVLQQANQRVAHVKEFVVEGAALVLGHPQAIGDGFHQGVGGALLVGHGQGQLLHLAVASHNVLLRLHQATLQHRLHLVVLRRLVAGNRRLNRRPARGRQLLLQPGSIGGSLVERVGGGSQLRLDVTEGALEDQTLFLGHRPRPDRRLKILAEVGLLNDHLRPHVLDASNAAGGLLRVPLDRLLRRRHRVAERRVFNFKRPDRVLGVEQLRLERVGDLTVLGVHGADLLAHVVVRGRRNRNLEHALHLVVVGLEGIEAVRQVVALHRYVNELALGIVKLGLERGGRRRPNLRR